MLLSAASLKPFMSQIDKVNKYIVDVALLREEPNIHEVIRLVEAEASNSGVVIYNLPKPSSLSRNQLKKLRQQWNRFKGEVMHFLENVFLDLPSPRTDAQDEEFHVRLSRFCRAKITKEGGFGWCYSGNIDGFGPAKYVDEVVSVFSDGEWTEYEVVRRRRTRS